MYSYDEYGWLVPHDIPGRQTSVAPPQETATEKANWTGIDWVLVAYSPPPPLSLAYCKTNKVARIRAHFAAVVEALKADAAPYEVDTWPVQTAEYSAWAANNAAPVPYIAALASARGITVSALMGKIGVKVAGLATIQGAQHALEDAVSAATTIAEIDAVAI